MYITPYREQAKKVEVHREGEYIYYNIFVGQFRIAEYIHSRWADRIIDGYNLLQKQEVDIINANRARKEYEAQLKEECNVLQH